MDTPQRLDVARVAIMTTEHASAEVLCALAEGHAVPEQRYEFDGTTLW